MGKIDPANVWQISEKVVYDPTTGRDRTIYVFRKKHNRVSHTKRAEEARKRFKEAAQACAGKPKDEYVACIRDKLAKD